MSCSYPSCYMGSHSCPYESDCDKEMEDARARSNEKARLDLEEQRLRIKKLKMETNPTGSNPPPSYL